MTPSLDDPEFDGWLLMRRAAVPERWTHRVVDLALVPLLPDEAASLLGDRPQLSADDELIVRLAARGHSLEAISREAGISSRAVSRRLANLRERFGAESNVALVALLARRGFG
jgi:DNA-binding CsgD family transcriptional regulator